MRRLNQKNMLSRAAIFFMLLLLFSCSRSAIQSRSVSDLSTLQNYVSDRNKLISTSNIKLKFTSVVNLNGKDNKLSGRISIFKDSCIFVNVISSALGVEICQARFSPDSVLFVNKLEKNYFYGSYNDFVKIIDVNYQSVFSILTASYIRSDSIDFNENKAFYFPEVKRFIVNDLFIYDGLKSYVTTEFDQFGNVEKIDFKSARSNFLQVNYSNFVNNFGFPDIVLFSTTIDREKVNFNMKITAIEISENYIPFGKVSSLYNYSRISL